MLTRKKMTNFLKGTGFATVYVRLGLLFALVWNSVLMLPGLWVQSLSSFKCKTMGRRLSIMSWAFIYLMCLWREETILKFNSPAYKAEGAVEKYTDQSQVAPGTLLLQFSKKVVPRRSNSQYLAWIQTLQFIWTLDWGSLHLIFSLAFITTNKTFKGELIPFSMDARLLCCLHKSE